MRMMRKLLDNIPFVAYTIEKNITFTHKILAGDERLILCDTPKMATDSSLSLRRNGKIFLVKSCVFSRLVQTIQDWVYIILLIGYWAYIF